MLVLILPQLCLDLHSQISLKAQTRTATTRKGRDQRKEAHLSDGVV